MSAADVEPWNDGIDLMLVPVVGGGFKEGRRHFLEVICGNCGDVVFVLK